MAEDIVTQRKLPLELSLQIAKCVQTLIDGNVTLTGPSEHAVAMRLHAIVGDGGRLLARPSYNGTCWEAMCEPAPRRAWDD